MRKPGKRDVKRTNRFFVDDLKVYQKSHKSLNEMIVQTSSDTGAYYGEPKYAGIVFERRKMVIVKVCKY